MKILVVDDEKLLVKGIKFNLENDGYEVVTGCDGMEAVELAASETPDQIEHDQIRRFARRQLHGLHAVAAGHDLVAVVFQIEFNALDEQLFIIYNQNFHSLSST